MTLYSIEPVLRNFWLFWLQVIVEIPYVFFQTTYYTFIVYTMVSFEWTAVKYFWFFFIHFLTFLYFTYNGLMAVALTPNDQLASILTSAFYALFNLFSGFFIPRPVISVPITFLLIVLYVKLHILHVHFHIVSENPKVVDMVLLDLPISMDLWRINCFAIWWCWGHH